MRKTKTNRTGVRMIACKTADPWRWRRLGYRECAPASLSAVISEGTARQLGARTLLSHCFGAVIADCLGGETLPVFLAPGINANSPALLVPRHLMRISC